MQYWKIVEAGDYKIYTIKLLALFHREYHEYFKRINDFWNPVKQKKLSTLLQKIPELNVLQDIFGEIRELTVLVLNGDNSSLHTDHRTGKNKDVQARLNIPMLNCKGSTTAFFVLPEAIKNLYTEDRELTRTWPQALRYKLPPVTQVNLVQPTILRTSEPHTVYCHSCGFPRIALTISFEKDLVDILDQE